jgi:tRNA nucleotidyltransferase/poly(A) polymerase
METAQKLNDVLKAIRESEWIDALQQTARVYIVGGVVRDIFRNADIKDVDLIVVGMTMDEIKDSLVSYGKVNIVGESFAVIKFRPFGHVGEDYDIAIPRKDKKTGNTHKDFEVLTEGVTLNEDLKRRDFTINSIAMNVKDMAIVDPYNGLEDLGKGIIRATDESSFIEDPLRMLRAIQFSSRFRFRIDDGTKEMIKSAANEISHIFGERKHEEFLKIIKKNGNSTMAMNLMDELGLSPILFGHNVEAIGVPSKLDEVSFFYYICRHNPDPSAFYMSNFKGEARIALGISNLKHLIQTANRSEERVYRLTIFNMLKKSDIIKTCVLLPIRAQKVISLMDRKVIPVSASDVKINGNDAKVEFPEFSGQQIGKLLDDIYMGALMKRFKWKNREDSIEYMKLIGGICKAVNFHYTNT